MPYVNAFAVGCDPEFFALHRANGTIKNVAGDLAEHGAVGYDHGGDVLELRPLQARSTRTLARRMARLIFHDRGLAALRDYKWRAGAAMRHRTIGGHVHLDLEGRQPAITRALDEVLGMCERLELLPRAENELRKAGPGGYGRPGDVRVVDGHYEYRAMPSWLYHPTNAMICLTLGKLAGVDAAGVQRAAQAAHSRAAVLAIFETFAHRDDDAARLVERGIAPAFGASCDTDIREGWAAYANIRA